MKELEEGRLTGAKDNGIGRSEAKARHLVLLVIPIDDQFIHDFIFDIGVLYGFQTVVIQ